MITVCPACLPAPPSPADQCSEVSADECCCAAVLLECRGPHSTGHGVDQPTKFDLRTTADGENRIVCGANITAKINEGADITYIVATFRARIHGN